MLIDSMTEAIHNLRSQTAGDLITPDDDGYNQARRAWALTIDQYPAFILMAETVPDVIAGVRFANDHDLPIAVQSTGHGVKEPANDSFLIITTRMNHVEVNAETRIARAEAGAKWQPVIDAAVPHGLAPLLGSAPHVGVVGYTLGGGIGWLARKYGLAADYVREIELVTPDGELRRASATENSDLFWGLLGGGGNFGVVTAVTFELVPVAELYGGSLIFAGENAANLLRFYRDWVKTAPDELTSSISVVKVPALPSIPQAMHGKKMFMLRAVYLGDAAAGEALIQPWLELQTPMDNTFRLMPFAEIGKVSNDPVDPTAGYGSNELLDALPDDVIDIIVRQMHDSESPLSYTEIRHGGGAIARSSANNAISNRDTEFYMQMAGLAPTPEAYQAVTTTMQRYREALRPYVRGGVYLNFTTGSDSRKRAKSAYPAATYERLLALKNQYDPQNRFRFSFALVDASVG